MTVIELIIYLAIRELLGIPEIHYCDDAIVTMTLVINNKQIYNDVT